MSKIQGFLRDIVENRKQTKGLTQRKLAELMGAKPAMISSLLSGKRRLNEEWIEKFCDVLGITLGDLEAPTHRIPESRVLREYSEKLKRLYEMSPEPAFRSISRAIDDWLEAIETGKAAKSKPTGSEDYLDSEHIEEEFNINHTNSDAPRAMEMFRVPHYEAIPAGTLTPIETRLHSPRTFHASRIKIQGVLIEIIRRTARRKQ